MLFFFIYEKEQFWVHQYQIPYKDDIFTPTEKLNMKLAYQRQNEKNKE